MPLLLGALLALVWSTGFLVGRIIVGHAEPNMFLLMRFGGAALLLFCLLPATRRIRLSGRMLAAQLGIGAVMNAVYLALSYTAIAHGLPAALMALFGGWQPVLTILLTALIARRAPGWFVAAATLVSLTGLVLVLAPRLSTGTLSLLPLILAFAAITLLTIGSMLQSRVAAVPLVQAVAWQTTGAALVSLAAVLILGEPLPELNGPVIGALVWSILGISVGGMALMVHLIRATSPTTVSLILLTAPPLAALEELWLFGEALGPLQIVGIGIVLTAVGAVLMRRRPESG